jgi:hypothetical protein
MGLETVELVMNVEDAFGIAIPDELASEIRTVGQLNDTVMELIRSNGNSALLTRADLESFVWQTLCKLSAKLASGTKPSDIKRSTRFLEDLGYGG